MHSLQVVQPLKLTLSTITRSGCRKDALFSAGETIHEKGVCSRRLGWMCQSQIALGLLYNLLIKLKSGIVSHFSQIMQLCLHRFQLRLAHPPVKTFSILLVNFVLLGRCSAEHYTLLKPRLHRLRRTSVI